MTLTLQKLLYFEKTADCGSITDASQVLNISQSAISQSIKDLEHYFKEPLFKRHNNGVILTELGVRVFSETKSINQTYYRLQDLAQEVLKPIKGEVRIAISNSGLHLLSLLYQKFTRIYPNINIKMINKEWNESIACLNDKSVDMALCAVSHHHPSHITINAVCAHSRRLWVHEKNPLSTVKYVTPNCLAGEKLFLYEQDMHIPEFSDYIKENNLLNDDTEIISSYDAIKTMVISNMGICILSEYTTDAQELINKDVMPKMLMPSPPQFILGILSNKNEKLSEPAKILSTFIMEENVSNIHSRVNQ